MADFYLASQSARRQELLLQAGARFDVLRLRTSPRRSVDVSEIQLDAELPGTYVRRVSREKALAGRRVIAQRGIADLPVLAADTTVELDNEVLGKPASRDEAIATLARLSGREHLVHTAVSVAWAAEGTEFFEQAVSSTLVRFRQLNSGQISRYADSGEPMDKAGAYGIQGLAALFVEHLSGSYTGVVGLPLFETASLLERAGVRLL